MVLYKEVAIGGVLEDTCARVSFLVKLKNLKKVL